MPQSLLALALVITQLLSWSLSPVYLCVERDGSFCIHSGPENCGCCCDDHASHEHFDAANHDCRLAVQGLLFEAECRADRAPCGCTHVQISGQQSPAVLSSADRAESARHVARWALAPPSLDSLLWGLDGGLPRHRELLSPPGDHASSISRPAALLSGVRSLCFNTGKMDQVFIDPLPPA